MQYCITTVVCPGFFESDDMTHIQIYLKPSYVRYSGLGLPNKQIGPAYQGGKILRCQSGSTYGALINPQGGKNS